jgi:hypothetical protein
MNISDEAVEAAAMAAYGGTLESWKLEDGAVRRHWRDHAYNLLETAAPYLSAGSVEEFGIFRKGRDWHDAPIENWTFSTRERAEVALRKLDGESWLEVRSRAATPWKPTNE